jgi:hypothetical protein
MESYMNGYSTIANGILVPIIRRTVFDFNCATNSTSEVIIADRLDTAKFPSGQLVVRYHTVLAFASGTATFRILTRNMSISIEEPQTDFVYAGDNSSVDFTSTDSAPLYRYQNYSSAGPATRVVVACIQGANAGQVQVAVSVDLLMRAI